MIRLCVTMKTRWKRAIWNWLWRLRSNLKPIKGTTKETIKEARAEANKTVSEPTHRLRAKFPAVR
jgi:hypothetical protein